MKNLLLATAASITVIAAVEATANDTTTKQCLEFHKIAETIMDARQKGLPMPQLIAAAEEEAVIEAVVRDAYNRPRYSTDNYRQREIQDFANDIYAECLKAFD